MMAMEASVILFGSFIIFMALGIPISASTVLATFVTAISIMPPDMVALMVVQKMVGGIDGFSLLAIPLFILSGNIMNNGGIAQRLVNFAKLLVGRLPGALAQTNIVGNMLFGSISGSGVAAAAAIGGTMTPIMKKEGYAPTFIAAVNIVSSPTGLLIPPSAAFIMYSLVAGGVSISALFVAGYLPGIIMGLACMVVAYWYAKKNDYPVASSVPLSEAARITMEALPSLLLIIIVIGGIIGGVFTATEGAAVAVLYPLVLSYFYKSLTWKNLKLILINTIATTGVVLFMIATSATMSWIMAYTGIPQALSKAILSISDNAIVLLFIMNMFLLAIGTFMDMTPAILIFTPIFLPIVTKLGMDPIQFGVVLIYNLCMGIMSPPSGSVLFVSCRLANVTIEAVTKPLIPYFVTLTIGLLLLTYIPAFSLWLPSVMGLIK
jgi:tripartite ATP-independent transporter DctM subunit